MEPNGRLKIVEAPKRFQGIFSNIYICRDQRENEFLFKQVKDREIINNEVLAWKLIPLANLKRIPYLSGYSMGEKKGILLSYLKEAKPLSQYEQILDAIQLRELQKIVLFDLWIGNRDRHTANILVYGGQLIPFDHGRIFQENNKPSRFIKLDLGIRLHKEWPDILERLKGKNTEEALIELSFNKEDIQVIRDIQDAQLIKLGLNNNILDFLRFKKDNLAKLQFY